MEAYIYLIMAIVSIPVAIIHAILKRIHRKERERILEERENYIFIERKK